MSQLKKLIHEVHRRSLWQVLGIYLVGAWIGYQVIQSLVEGVGLPAWLPGLAIVLFIIGLPIVLATAFVQEGTPLGGGAKPQETTGERGVEIDAESHRVPGERAGLGGLFTWRNAIAGGVLAFALWGLAATALLLSGGGSDGTAVASLELDANVVAVLPFRVAGSDPSLVYLQEGMVDLLAAKLTGETGPRAADPRSTISAWRRSLTSDGEELPQGAALEVAGQLGAGQLLLGGLVGTPSGLVMNASVLSVPDGAVLAEASVEGSADSLPALVDRLAGTLLALEAGEQHRLVALTSRSLPALKTYLQGKADYRQGRFSNAIDQFHNALDSDSTFALAGLGMLSATGWFSGRPGSRGRGRRAAWAGRDRLSERDRVFLTGLIGPRYPAPSPRSEYLAAQQRAVRLSPDRPEVWQELADEYFHYGAALGLDDPLARAESAFRKALELDPTFIPALHHLVQLSSAAGDSAEARRLGELYLAQDSAGEAADAVHWWVAWAVGDTAALSELRDGLAEFSGGNLFRVLQWGQFTTSGAEDAQRAAELLALSPTAGFAAWRYKRGLELNGGRPQSAVRTDEAFREPGSDLWYAVVRLGDALYSNGDSSAAAGAADLLAPFADAALAEDREERALQYNAITWLEQWRLWHGESGTTPRAIEKLRSAAEPGDGPNTVARAGLLAMALEALLATVENRPDAESYVARLDSLCRTVPAGSYETSFTNLLVARLWDSLGDQRAALAALRRRVYFLSLPDYLSTSLREEGRLATLTGDTEGAIAAYSHYLALRPDPEPELLGEVTLVQEELARLVGEGSQ
jgi:tetratricopeptide (TPR) repeat protein